VAFAVELQSRFQVARLPRREWLERLIMSSLLEEIDTTHVGEKKPGGGGPTDGSAEEKSNALKLVFAVVVLLGGVGLIVWQLTSGTKPGTVLPSAPHESVNVPPTKAGGPQRAATPVPGATADGGDAPVVGGSPRDLPSIPR
jgi:hypothetical protein